MAGTCELGRLEKKRTTPTVGLVTGLSYVSGVTYYQQLNEKVTAVVGTGEVIPHNPEIVMISLDCDPYAAALGRRDYAAVIAYLVGAVRRLRAAEVDFVCLASNTAHIAAPAIAAEGMPLLHIADATACEALAHGHRRLGLLGTEPTMREDYLKKQLGRHGVEVLVPGEDDQQVIFGKIMHELGFGVFSDETRDYFVAQIHSLVARGAQGIILGCTEIEELELEGKVPGVRLYRSAGLHIDAIANVLAGQKTLATYSPA
mmetsp:Transcript_6699/g.18909  ORF Transcript_6699/g.18909 Transcript_6699/m.18909 type:complete len:259 (+) Transcript_6699:172-948(+)